MASSVTFCYKKSQLTIGEHLLNSRDCAICVLVHNSIESLKQHGSRYSLLPYGETEAQRDCSPLSWVHIASL